MLLDSAADHALFDGKIQALVVACYENERPLRGLAGLLDWRFEGFLSLCIREGAFGGKPGECVYLPVTRAGRVYHLLLAGAGQVPIDRDRGPLPEPTLERLSRNLQSLKLASIGVSRSDLGNVSEKSLRERLKPGSGGELWIGA